MQRHSGIFIIALLAFALALRVLVPTGWMPAWSGQGQFAFVPCPAAAPALQAHGHRHSAPAKEHRQADKPCPFAPLLSSAAPPDMAASDFAPTVPTAKGTELPRSPELPADRADVRTPPSTGPPARA
jgi:hypothetical protein